MPKPPQPDIKIEPKIESLPEANFDAIQQPTSQDEGIHYAIDPVVSTSKDELDDIERIKLKHQQNSSLPGNAEAMAQALSNADAISLLRDSGCPDMLVRRGHFPLYCLEKNLLANEHKDLDSSEQEEMEAMELKLKEMGTNNLQSVQPEELQRSKKHYDILFICSDKEEDKTLLEKIKANIESRVILGDG